MVRGKIRINEKLERTKKLSKKGNQVQADSIGKETRLNNQTIRFDNSST